MSTWSQLFPDGRHIYYEGEDPDGLPSRFGPSSVSTLAPIPIGAFTSRRLSTRASRMPLSTPSGSTARLSTWTPSMAPIATR